MTAGYLFIYLPVNLLFVRAGCTGVEKQGSVWVITQKKFLAGIQITVLCSIAQVISHNHAVVVFMLSVSYHQEWQDSLWFIQMKL